MKSLFNYRVTPYVFAFLIAASIFPPWVRTYSTGELAMSTSPAGYGFILDPPTPEFEEAVFGLQVDWSRLLLEYFAIIGTGAFVVCIGLIKSNSREKIG